MNLNVRRRDRTNQEMGSSLTFSLFLLSLVLMQFVSAAADQNNVTIKAEPGGNVILTCKDPDQGKITIAEWKRNDLGTEYVLLYKDNQFDPDAQHSSYSDRADLLCIQLRKGDVSLILKNTTTEDSGTYECRIATEKLKRKLISTIILNVSPPPDPLPFWVTFLLVLALVAAAAGVSLYFWLRWKPVPEQVEVESGVESVKLPFKVPRRRWFCKYRIFLPVDKVEWKDRDNRKVHVNQNGSDQPEEQDEIYRTRTKMDEKLLKAGDLSLTLRWPTGGDEKTYICRVYSKMGDILMEKDIKLKVKVQQVEVEPGVKSVLLSWTITEDLDGDVRVEWRDRENRKVHVHQNGSDQPEDQNQRYRTRTTMDENLLRNKDLSLTLRWPLYGDSGIYTCRVFNRDRVVLMMKQVQLQVKEPEQVEVEPGVASVKLPWTITEDLDGDVRVEWRDGDNRKVHVYQNGSDLPGDQDQIYRTRTKMDENLLETKDLSLTLRRPREMDRGIYTCRVYRAGIVLMMKQVQVEVKAPEVEVEPGVEFVLLPCITTEDLDGDVRVEWMDNRDRTVHVYQNGSDQPGDQDPSYKDRTKMDENLLETKDLSLTLRRPTERDRGTNTCRVYRDRDVLMEREVWLKVEVQQVEVESGKESVELPWTIKEDLDRDVRVEWKDDRDRKVHVYQNGSDQPGDHHQIYKDRTKMDENLLRTKDLSLTLRRPTDGDMNIYTCRVSNRDGVVLMMKRVQLRVKVPKVKVESGVKSVLLPCRTTESLDKDVRVVWRDRYKRKVHVCRNGSDQPREQDPSYRTRTKMDKKLLKNKDLSLTLKRPTEKDGGRYICIVYNRDADILMEKLVQLEVKAGTVQVQPEDIRKPLLADQSV